MRKLLNLAIIGLANFIAGITISCSGGSGETTDSGGGGSTQQAISCETGTVEMTEVFEVDLEGSGPGIYAAGDCNVIINSPGVVSLTNCVECIRVLGDASVEINAASSVVLESTIDGIRAQGNATVMLQAEDEISITSSGEDGIDVENDSLVTLNAPDCVIRAFDQPIDIEGKGVVNATGCTNSDFSQAVP